MREVSAEANQLLAPRWRIISHPQVNRTSGASTYLSHVQKGSCLVPLGKVRGQNSWSSHFYYDAQQDADLKRERWWQRASSSHRLSKPFHRLVREVIYKFPMGHLKHPDDHQGNLYLCAKRLTTVVTKDPQFNSEDNLLCIKVNVLLHKIAWCKYFEVEHGLCLCGVSNSMRTHSNTSKLL